MSNSNDHAASDEAPADPGEQLIQWAKDQFGELTRAEEAMLRGTASGEGADVSSDIEEENDPATASSWHKDRSIRAELLRWLCVDQGASTLVDPKGVRIRGARIGGRIDIESATVSFGLELVWCAIPDGFNLRRAEIQWLTLDGTQTSGLYANELRVKNSISLCNGFEASDKVMLLNAIIGGQLTCRGGKFLNEDGIALHADGINVTSNVFLGDGFEARGAVRFLGAIIGGQLNCSGGKFINEDGIALQTDKVNVTSSVFLGEGFEASGEVRLLGSTIGGQLNCSGGKFINENGFALSADRVNVTESVYLDNGFEARGEVRLPGATINGSLYFDCSTFSNLNLLDMQVGGSLFVRDMRFSDDSFFILTAAIVDSIVDDEQSWPESLKDHLRLDGFQYKRFGGDNSPTYSAFRIRWLELQKSTPFHPQPYEQLAKVFREMGHNRDARNVLVAKEDAYHKHGDLTRRGKMWHRLLGITIGYGYRTHRAAWWLLGFFLIGWALFAWGASENLLWPTDRNAIVDIDIDGKIFAETGEVRVGYQSLNSFMYSLDTLVPIVDFHQQKYWLPNAEQGWGGWLLRCYLWLHIVAGWFLSTMLVVGLTGLARSK